MCFGIGEAENRHRYLLIQDYLNNIVYKPHNHHSKHEKSLHSVQGTVLEDGSVQGGIFDNSSAAPVLTDPCLPKGSSLSVTHHSLILPCTLSHLSEKRHFNTLVNNELKVNTVESTTTTHTSSSPGANEQTTSTDNVNQQSGTLSFVKEQLTSPAATTGQPMVNTEGITNTTTGTQSESLHQELNIGAGLSNVDLHELAINNNQYIHMAQNDAAVVSPVLDGLNSIEQEQKLPQPSSYFDNSATSFKSHRRNLTDSIAEIYRESVKYSKSTNVFSESSMQEKLLSLLSNYKATIEKLNMSDAPLQYRSLTKLMDLLLPPRDAAPTADTRYTLRGGGNGEQCLELVSRLFDVKLCDEVFHYGDCFDKTVVPSSRAEQVVVSL